MRLRYLRTPVAFLCLVCGLVACGGSSSETPEPERPDSWQLKLRQANREAALPTSADDATEQSASPLRDLDEPTSAQSTWGGTRRTVKSAPQTSTATKTETVPAPSTAPPQTPSQPK